MNQSQKMLLLQFSEVEELISKTRGDSYSDNNKASYHENLIKLFDGINPLMVASLNSEFGKPKDFKNFFQETRRQLGETIVLYPGQTVLATSLEDVKLPSNVMLSLYMRSSYSRLGLTISTIAQPGYCGCLSMELTNNNHSPINLTVGARLVQGVLTVVDADVDYFSSSRKYSCAVRPQVTTLNSDEDLEVLNAMWKEINNIDD